MKLRRKQIREKGKTIKAKANKGKRQNKRRKLIREKSKTNKAKANKGKKVKQIRRKQIREKGKTKGEILSRLFSLPLSH